MSLAALIVAAAFAAASPPQPADFGPTWSPGALQLAYSHTRDNSSLADPVLLVTRNLDGSPGRSLVHPSGTGDSSASATDAAWSPDGRQIAYTFADPERAPEESWVFLTNLDGSSSSFTQVGSWPDWSPDGTRIVFTAFGDLWTIGRDGTGRRQLTATQGYELEPAWSRDGTTIAFLRDNAVWTIKNDGSTGQTRVGPGSEPVWGPDGLVHVRNGRLVSRGRAITPASLVATGPAFSRDGTKLAFAGDVRDCAQPGLFVAAGNGTALKRLTGRDCRIFGTARDETIAGTAARDIIDGRGGRDRIRAGGGHDDVRARDRAIDTIVCGAGRDTVLADRVDAVARDCESVRRA